jgi:murein peptide amidase A
MSAVKAAPIDPIELVSRFEKAGARAGFRSEVFGSVGPYPLIALTRRASRLGPRIYLSAGIHGDEPAAPLALASLLESGELDDRATWFLCPMLNPDGTARGTRENADGVDLNRDYRHLRSHEVRAHVRWMQMQPGFDLAVCVHEDWESTGFYLYELNPDNRPSLAEPMIVAVSAVCPIDPSPLIEGREAKGGIIRPLLDPLARELWPESIYLQAHHTRLSYTSESPSALALNIRIAALTSALRTAISRAARAGS